MPDLPMNQDCWTKSIFLTGCKNVSKIEKWCTNNVGRLIFFQMCSGIKPVFRCLTMIHYRLKPTKSYLLIKSYYDSFGQAKRVWI